MTNGSLAAAHPFVTVTAAGQAHLRILATTDIHVGILPYNYHADRPVDTLGLSRTASLIAMLRAEATNVILVDNGDLLQGNPLGDFIVSERGLKRGDVHPLFKAMNTLGYEVSTLGNHEFNYGLDFLEAALAGADFPFVSANVIRGTQLAGNPRNDTTLLRPYRIVERTILDGAGLARSIRIGFIGFVPPQIQSWDRKHLAGKVVARDIVEAARAWVPEMKEAGADVIVALCHSGISASPAFHGMENAARPLAEVPGIDVLVLGHQHRVFPGPDFIGVIGVDATDGTIVGKPAVMAGFSGSHLGVIDLLLAVDGSTWRVAGSTSQARPIYRRDGATVVPLVASEPAVVEAAEADHAATIAYIRRPVGHARAALTSYFALVADNAAIQMLADAQIDYIRQMLVGSQWEGSPLLSAAAPFKSGGRGGPDYYTDIPAGPIAIKNVADLYLYPNTIRALAVAGSNVREWLEHSASQFLQIEPGRADQPLIDPSYPSFDFDVIDGVSYKIDLTQPARYNKDGALIHPDASRIVDLAFEGRPIDEAATFIIATSDYRAGGGGSFPGTGPDAVVFAGADTIPEILIRAIVQAGEIDPKPDGNWTFAPIDGASALFVSGPKARAHIPNDTIAYVGEGPDGFALFRLSF